QRNAQDDPDEVIKRRPYSLFLQATCAEVQVACFFIGQNQNNPLIYCTNFPCHSLFAGDKSLK
ncbi:MAG: hypothetical protein ACR2K1_09275, partial [Saprospiraceae bacterium]